MNNEEHGQGESLVAVYLAQDEGAAHAVKSLLESEAIPVVLLDKRSTWGGYATFAHPEYYAKIAVPEKFALRAKHILDAIEKEARQPTLREAKKVKLSVVSYKIWSTIGVFLSGATIWIVYRYGYQDWFWIFGLFALGVGSTNFEYLKPAPDTFRRTIMVYSISHFPVGIALTLAAFTAIGRMHLPLAVFSVLSGLSVIGFAYATLRRIVEEPHEY